MARYKIIANPVSGNGRGAREIPHLEALLQQHGLAYDLTITERHWHAAELAQQAAPNYDVIVAAGGDGTVNEVINGLMAHKLAGGTPPPLGVLCIGRGNDFAFGMGIPKDLTAGVAALAAKKTRTIDIGRVTGGMHPEGRYFGNCVGVGFDAVGTIEAGKLPAYLGGFLGYLVAVLRTIFLYYKGPVVDIFAGDQEPLALLGRQGTLLVSIMNGRRIGGGFLMAPTGQPDDGLLDLCIANQVTRRRILTLVPHFTRGTQVSQPEIKTGQARRVVVQAVQGTLPAQTDGEIISIEGLRLEVELFHRQLDVIFAEGGSK